MMSGFENLDVILGDDNIVSIERELSIIIGNQERHCDTDSNSQLSENIPQGNEFGHYVHENIVPGFQETMGTFTSKFIMRQRSFSGNGHHDVHDAYADK